MVQDQTFQMSKHRKQRLCRICNFWVIILGSGVLISTLLVNKNKYTVKEREKDKFTRVMNGGKGEPGQFGSLKNVKKA